MIPPALIVSARVGSITEIDGYSAAAGAAYGSVS
jgi:hypothetical protein